MTFANTVQRILSLVDYELFLGAMGHPAQGQFVVTGPQMGGTDSARIGYCVQVRKNRGAYGSNAVFLRHADGGLTVHENQSFFALTPEQEVLAREIFTDLPENEDYSHGYTIRNEYREIGFLIESGEGDHPVAPNAGNVHLTLKSRNKEGADESTLIAFV